MQCNFLKNIYLNATFRRNEPISIWFKAEDNILLNLYISLITNHLKFQSFFLNNLELICWANFEMTTHHDKSLVFNFIYYSIRSSKKNVYVRITNKFIYGRPCVHDGK